MTWPNKHVLRNYTVRAFLLFAITATRPAHHNSDTLTAVSKIMKMCPTVRYAGVSEYLRIASGCVYFFDWLTDWIAIKQTSTQLTNCLPPWCRLSADPQLFKNFPELSGT